MHDTRARFDRLSTAECSVLACYFLVLYNSHRRTASSAVGKFNWQSSWPLVDSSPVFF